MSDAPAPADALEDAITARVAAALRRRGAVQRQRAADGTSSPGESFPHIEIRSPEAALALKLAADFDAIAVEIEAGLGR